MSCSNCQGSEDDSSASTSSSQWDDRQFFGNNQVNKELIYFSLYTGRCVGIPATHTSHACRGTRTASMFLVPSASSGFQTCPSCFTSKISVHCSKVKIQSTEEHQFLRQEHRNRNPKHHTPTKSLFRPFLNVLLGVLPALKSHLSFLMYLTISRCCSRPSYRTFFATLDDLNPFCPKYR